MPGLSEPGALGVTITWLGHATVLFEIAGARLLTDPLLRSRVAHLRRRTPLPAELDPIDGVLISHVHRDHLDRPSLLRLAAPQTTAVIPAGAATLLAGMPFGAVREVQAGDVLEVAGAPVIAVPAWHDGRRRPGGPQLPTLGFLVGEVWFAGDTDLNAAMTDLRGRVDVALLPIWGWGTSLGPGHMDPEGAARAVALVAPRIVVPIHWGTYLPIGLGHRHDELLVDPPVEFARHVAELAPATRVETLSPGGSLAL